MHGGEEAAAGGNTVHGPVTNLISVNAAHGGITIASQDGPAVPVPQQWPPAASDFENQVTSLESLNSPSPPGPVLNLIIGSPGTGKSALALHWGNLVTDRFPDGRIYLDLRGHDPERAIDPHEALGYLLASLGADPALIPGDTDQRAAFWRSRSFSRRLLVLLDNAADSDQVVPLLSTGPGTVTVVTSRNALSELALLAGTRTTAVDLLAPDYATALLRRMIEPRRGPVDQRDLAELARRCGYLQLALRVAVQRLLKSPLLTVAELAGELQGRARILGPVRAVFDGSYRTLRPATARLFRLLGVAPGSDLSTGAITALADTDPATVREQIEELWSGHLLAPGRPGRYVVHDLLQAYAAEIAASELYQEESDAGLDRLGLWYARTVSAAAQALGSEQRFTPASGTTRASAFASGAEAQQWYSVEEANLSVMVGALTARGLNRTAVQLCFALVEVHQFLNAAPWIDTARTGLELAVQSNDTLLRAWFLESWGKALAQTGLLDEALHKHETALALRREAGDAPAQARSLNAIGLVHLRARRWEQAEALFTECLRLAETHQDDDFQTFALMNLGHVTLRQAEQTGSGTDFGRALALLDTALGRFQPDQQPFYRVNAERDRTGALLGLGRPDEALDCAAEAADLARRSSTPLGLASALRSLAQVKLALGDHAGADTDLTESLELFRVLGDTVREAEVRAQRDGLTR